MTYRKPVNSMWAQAVNMLEQADRMHRQFFRLSHSRAPGPTWEPPVDVFEADHELFILIALPGVAPDQVNTLLDAGSLVVIAERPMPAPANAQIRRIEIPYGHFERRIELPPGRFEIQKSTLQNGCLILNLLRLA